MGQAEIYEFLKNHPNQKFTSKELAKALNVQQSATIKAMARMRKIMVFHDKHLKSELTGNVHYYLRYWYEDNQKGDMDGPG